MKFISQLLKIVVLLSICALISQASNAADIYNALNLPAKNAKAIKLDQLTSKFPKGSIIVVGEQHNFKLIQEGQLDLLNSLRKQGHRINVGMEFLRYPDQSQVDNYKLGLITEDEFLKTGWGKADFQFYREQILFPNVKNNEKTFAINSPEFLPLAVKEKGLKNLSDEEKSHLPPEFELGSENYKERFIERMNGHVQNSEAMERYFETQSLWDDTMAWKACEAANNSLNTTVLIVGQFHIEYSDGLIDRIKKRCGAQHPIISIYQFLFYNDEKVIFEPFMPSEKYGPISDYLMFVREK